MGLPVFFLIALSDMLYIISELNANQSILQLKRQIDALRRKLLGTGPLHPGSVSRQYQVCGNPGCRCMNPKNPQRHGPYCKLAYVYRGKPVCRFVRADCVTEVQKRLANYKTFREIIDRLISLSIQQGKIDLFGPRPVPKTKGGRKRSGHDPHGQHSPQAKPS